ncbi:hypothetical protein DAEQUDRAFT_725237 [Daedalea quercina L-15889]|uniref:Uncharacterized protein n=1 Tax=Daedalea quercina L-15889 TaxID=1314783 RepID=A0A165RFG8_9APHY|nr:hypothetical protein DAEQUDRAFT_725237 [Daedalea quercina L-15889]
MNSRPTYISIYIHYRINGSKAAYMRSRRTNHCNFFTQFTKRDLRFLPFPAPQETTLEDWSEAKVHCRWLLGADDEEDDTAEKLREQIEFLRSQDAAELLESLEISKVELVQPPPPDQHSNTAIRCSREQYEAPTEQTISEYKDLLAQHKACVTLHHAQNDEIREKLRVVQERERDLILKHAYASEALDGRLSVSFGRTANE